MSDPQVINKYLPGIFQTVQKSCVGDNINNLACCNVACADTCQGNTNCDSDWSNICVDNCPSIMNQVNLSNLTTDYKLPVGPPPPPPFIPPTSAPVKRFVARSAVQPPKLPLPDLQKAFKNYCECKKKFCKDGKCENIYEYGKHIIECCDPSNKAGCSYFVSQNADCNEGMKVLNGRYSGQQTLKPFQLAKNWKPWNALNLVPPNIDTEIYVPKPVSLPQGYVKAAGQNWAKPLANVAPSPTPLAPQPTFVPTTCPVEPQFGMIIPGLIIIILALLAWYFLKQS